ncbi:hypothetical protein MACH09_45770 [Vibrio sp. MACH09]|uniref:hypothetical protein n=1 Tax=Vibrio sp. MACH09 TaxID=3025122 RepID=UPI00278F0D70|nr:hypothetical protein [Vibrio sp. MACH09]GLO64069.1 hypothetical protein MACH09_45770 [Vibrio sp. MACH09]
MRDPVSNIAENTPPQTFEIVPSHGKPVILLNGWLRAWAEFENHWQTESLPFVGTTKTTNVRQEIFEATDGSWLITETIVDANTVNRSTPSHRTCRTWHFKTKKDIKPVFVHRQYVEKLLASIDIPYSIVIGGAHE